MANSLTSQIRQNVSTFVDAVEKILVEQMRLELHSDGSEKRLLWFLNIIQKCKKNQNCKHGVQCRNLEFNLIQTAKRIRWNASCSCRRIKLDVWHNPTSCSCTVLGKMIESSSYGRGSRLNWKGPIPRQGLRNPDLLCLNQMFQLAVAEQYKTN